MNFNDLRAANWHQSPSADPVVVQEMLGQSGLDLPEDYLVFLRFSNGGDGDLGQDAGWFSLWPAEEVVQLNRDYGIKEWVPNFFGIGSDGGGEALVFDTRAPQPWKIYRIPFISPEEDDALLVAESFAAFVEMIARV